MALAITLIAIGVLHFIWAFSPWPFKDVVTFTKTIGGSDDGVMPPGPSAVLVGLALIGGAVLTLMVNGSIPDIGPRWLQSVGMYGLAVDPAFDGVALAVVGPVEFRWPSA
ncbi:DUF3995 domain-containing protein [Streptomyces inhibens]|uniref:DUF3995 domain-containing protein n=1 Tax=Streptomyces inhibens TaxID=2293571 RepID=UPI00379F7EE1